MQDSRKRIVKLGYITLVLAVLLTAASFAWMSISSTPMVTDLALTVVTENALELAPDADNAPGEWGTILDLSELSALKAPLKPATFLAAEDAFFAPNYGLDGRINFSKPIRLTDQKGIPLSSADTAGKAGESGYLYFCDFWIRTQASDCKVSFTQTVEREDGKMGSGTFLVGEPVWDSKTGKHSAAGSSAEYAMRIALRIDNVDDKGVKEGDPVWIIYEPSKEEGKTTYSIDGSGPLEGKHKLIEQEPSNWSDKTPPLKNEVDYKAGKFISKDNNMFDLKTNHAKHVYLYMWVEGQDVDCTQEICNGHIYANLQFQGDTGNASSKLKPE